MKPLEWVVSRNQYIEVEPPYADLRQNMLLTEISSEKIYLHTGVRATEARMRWKQVNFEHRTITVGHSKTKGGEGRMIPLNDEAYETVVEWYSRFTDPQPDHYVFPSERYRRGTCMERPRCGGLHPAKAMGSIKSAWTRCRKTAGVKCRLTI